MKLKIFTIGKLSLKPVGELVKEYTERIRRYHPIDIVVFKSVAAALEKCDSASTLVILDERGKAFTSTQFSKWFEEKEIHSTKSLIFLIGPGEGLNPNVKSRADLLLSLSPMTLQHELALVVLLEQLYRACTLIHHVPYHK